MEYISAGLRELYAMFSLEAPIVTKDMRVIVHDVDNSDLNSDLINFLRGNSTEQPLLNKQPAKDDNSK